MGRASYPTKFDIDQNVNYYYYYHNNTTRFGRFEDENLIGLYQHGETRQQIPHHLSTKYFGNELVESRDRYYVGELNAHDSTIFPHDDIAINDYHDETSQQPYYTKI